MSLMQKLPDNILLSGSFYHYCDRDRIQTCNPHIRSVVLYSVELRSHFSLASAKIRLIFNYTKEKAQKNTSTTHFNPQFTDIEIVIIYKYSIYCFI